MKVLIACVGNIFLGDDGFGVEVARSLSKRQLPEGVSVKDYGIRGFDLAYALLDPWELVIMVDALSRGEAAGTLYVIEPELNRPASADTALNPHGMDPVRVLSLAASMGTISAQVMVVGCEPHDFGDELEGRMGLSSPIQGVVEASCDMILNLVASKASESRQANAVRLQTVER
jgi:hydrogenase maturation protease